MRPGRGTTPVQQLKEDLMELLVDEDALTTVEYALLLALLVLGCAVCFRGLGIATRDAAAEGSDRLPSGTISPQNPPAPTDPGAPPSS